MDHTLDAFELKWHAYEFLELLKYNNINELNDLAGSLSVFPDRQTPIFVPGSKDVLIVAAKQTPFYRANFNLYLMHLHEDGDFCQPITVRALQSSDKLAISILCTENIKNYESFGFCGDDAKIQQRTLKSASIDTLRSELEQLAELYYVNSSSDTQ